jgi:hypothetical protein
LLHVQACGCAMPAATVAAETVSLGAALCMEIAAEMQGQLLSVRDEAAAARYRLCLPNAESEAPGTQN